jgi:hypothetical protein
MPVVAQVQALVMDAELALTQVEILVEQLQLTDAQKATVHEAVKKSRDALRVAERTLVAASTACSEPDVKAAFADLADSWSDIEGVLFSKSTLGAAVPRADSGGCFAGSWGRLTVNR